MTGLTAQSKAHIRKVANSAWKRLYQRPPIDLRAICDFLGITLLFETPPNGSRGLWLNDHPGGTIYVSSALPHIDQRLVLAHEIGHAIWSKNAPGAIGDGVACYSHKGLLERRCDYFAKHLLVPDIPLMEQIAVLDHRKDSDRTAMLASLFGVSFDVMRRRLREFGVDHTEAR